MSDPGAGRTGVVLMDGGMGTTVEDRGADVRNELWGSAVFLTPEGRALNDRVHREFVEAGARIVIANTHSASLEACRAWCRRVPEDGPPEDLLDRVLRAAVAGARRAAPEGSGIRVAAGLGSVEGPYARESRHSPEEVARALEPQVRALRDLGIDLLLFETLTTREEIRGVAALARELGPFSFGAGLTCGGEETTLAGVSMEEAADILLPAGPEAVFVQCTPYHAVMRPLPRLVRALGDRAEPGVYANDGRTWDGTLWHGERTSPETYAREAVRWREAGARIIGGCCGTGPEHIRALALVL